MDNYPKLSLLPLLIWSTDYLGLAALSWSVIYLPLVATDAPLSLEI